MLTRNRPAMAERAVACFHEQTYPAARLLILDNGDQRVQVEQENGIYVEQISADHGLSFGRLRNAINSYTMPDMLDAEIIVQWDDDDLSLRFRIAEQVEYLQTSGAEAVGYSDMLFWDTTRGEGEAWLYANPNPSYFLDTSACYWRETWERKAYRDMGAGADTVWWTGLRTAATSSLRTDLALRLTFPRMIASIHGGNMSSRVEPGKREWKRLALWDNYCRRVMDL